MRKLSFSSILIEKVFPEDRKQLRRLRLRGGDIWSWFITCETDKSYKGKVFLCKFGKKILGWALVHFGCEWRFRVYVASKFRRLGIGTKLYKKAKKEFKTFGVCRFDFVSNSFYNFVKAN